MKRIRLGSLASGGGTNLQAIIDAAASGELHADLAVVISNNSTSGALRRARNAGIPGFHLSGATHPEDAALDSAILGTLPRPRGGRGSAGGLHEDAGAGGVVAVRRASAERAPRAAAEVRREGDVRPASPRGRAGCRRLDYRSDRPRRRLRVRSRAGRRSERGAGAPRRHGRVAQSQGATSASTGF